MRAGLFLVISLLLFVLWAGSFLMLHVASMMIHLLLLVSVLFLAGHLVRDTSLS
jgi:Ca2+/Na+ antiporter